MLVFKSDIEIKDKCDSIELKYQRRDRRTINKQTFEINEPTPTRSRTMSKIRSKDTSIEKILEQELINENINYSKPEFIIEFLPGKPDFVIPRFKVAIFCDGDFWHGRNIDKQKFSSNEKFWEAKIRRNIERDSEVNEFLIAKGWKVLRFWEDDLRNNLSGCMTQIKAYLNTVKRRNKVLKAEKFTFIDLFSGIGGFRAALDECGGKCLGFSEIDKEATKVYKKNYVEFGSNEIEFGSVTNIGKLPFSVDLIVGGVPCQSWSVAGNMKGFEDPRGQLWYDTIRIVEKNKPKAFIFENVKGLYDPRNKESLDFILNSFRKMGYSVTCNTLNSSDFGLPQNRVRVFIVGTRKDLKNIKPFNFPEPLKSKNLQLYNFIEGTKISKDVIKKTFDSKDLFGEKIPFSRNKFQKLDELNDFFVLCDTRNGHTSIHSWDIINTTKKEKEICFAILRNRRKKIYGPLDGNPLTFSNLKELVPDLKELDLKSLIEKKILRKSEQGYEFVNSKNSAGINGVYRVYMPSSNIFSTLTATGTKDMVALVNIEADSPEEYRKKFISEVYRKKNFRPITAREAGKLQGFPNWFTIDNNLKLANKQFGNAVSVPVINNLVKELIKTNIFK